MSKETNPGILLTRFLEKEWDALYTTRGAWCREHGLADSTVLRWGQGMAPDLINCRLVAAALNVRLVEVLYHCGYIEEDEMRARTVAPPRARVDLETAIKTDATLSQADKNALLAVHTALTGKSVATTRASSRP